MDGYLTLQFNFICFNIVGTKYLAELYLFNFSFKNDKNINNTFKILIKATTECYLYFFFLPIVRSIKHKEKHKTMTVN